MLFKSKNKHNDFKSALSFLEQYGFEYTKDSATGRRECYKNYFGEIVLGYKQLDPNYWVPEISIEINYWKTVINIDVEYKKLKKKRTFNFYRELYEVVNYELHNNYKIFNLSIEQQYIDKIKGIIRYVYPYKKEHLIFRLKNDAFQGHWKSSLIKADDDILVIRLKSYHANKYGENFVAKWEEIDGKTYIEGRIYCSFDDGTPYSSQKYTKQEKIKDLLLIFVVLLFIWWLLLIFAVIYTVESIWNRIKYGAPAEEKSLEEQLDETLVNICFCDKQ